MRIKDDNPELDLSYDYFKNTKYIESIKLSNLKSMNEFDLITSKMRELLAKQVSTWICLVFKIISRSVLINCKKLYWDNILFN